MITVSEENLQQLIPLASQWAAAKERAALENGKPLTADQLADAAAIGVRHPETVRVFLVAQIPYPKHPILKAATDATRLISEHTAGITFQYGIFIRSEFSTDRYVLTHELAHTAQYETFGGIPAFMERYLNECFAYGYENAPLEKAADEIARRVLSRQP
jgi:hypothetical protein